jgi:hypothetical protein
VESPQFSYSAYGLRLTSDRPIPGLSQLDSHPAKSRDLHIEFEDSHANHCRGTDPTRETLWYTTDIQDAEGNPALKIWKGNSSGDYFIRYTHGLAFRLNAELSRVCVLRSRPLSDEDVAPFLLGPVLGIVLRLRGVTSLHASAVEIGGKAVAFVGVPGAGKSTTAAIFAQNGYSVLTDDIVALEKHESEFLVHPGYPFLNLLPRSLALLRGFTEVTEEADRYAEKRQLMLDGHERRFEKDMLPLGAVYFLAERSNDASKTTVSAISAQEALIALVSNTYANKMLDQEMRAREFNALGELVRLVPMRRVAAAARAANLDDFFQVICEDAATMMNLPQR